MTFVWAESGNRYTEGDLALAEALASRAALAIDNARLYRERDHIARALQQSLLPPELPRIPGIEAAGLYRASGTGADVGDFYDLFEAGRGTWAAVIGDVCGKGPDAAALVGVVRSTVRATVMKEGRPREVLQVVNEAVRQHVEDGRFCTVCYVRVRPRPSGAQLTVCSGGHPLPLVLRAGGMVQVGGRSGSLLGVFEDPDLSDEVVDLLPGDALVLYTDGVTDEQQDGQESGGERLQRVLRSCAGLDAEAIADRLETALLEFSPESPRDDMAILILRVAA